MVLSAGDPHCAQISVRGPAAPRGGGRGTYLSRHVSLQTTKLVGRHGDSQLSRETSLDSSEESYLQLPPGTKLTRPWDQVSLVKSSFCQPLA